MVVAIGALFASVALKAWSTFLLWDRYKPQEYWSDGRARRLFLVGKATPLTACLAIVVLAYLIGVWWLEVPAWAFFAFVSYGVVTRIRCAQKE